MGVCMLEELGRACIREDGAATEKKISGRARGSGWATRTPRQEEVAALTDPVMGEETQERISRTLGKRMSALPRQVPR